MTRIFSALNCCDINGLLCVMCLCHLLQLLPRPRMYSHSSSTPELFTVWTMFCQQRRPGAFVMITMWLSNRFSAVHKKNNGIGGWVPNYYDLHVYPAVWDAPAKCSRDLKTTHYSPTVNIKHWLQCSWTICSWSAICFLLSPTSARSCSDKVSFLQPMTFSCELVYQHEQLSGDCVEKCAEPNEFCITHGADTVCQKVLYHNNLTGVDHNVQS